jgi:starvation-inducible outer membrane lipoprotein
MQQRQHAAHKMIARWGGIGQLVNATDNTIKRDITVARMDYTPKERAGLQIDAETRLRISAKGMTSPPDYENEIVTFRGKNYRMLMPPSGPSSDGATFAFWDVPVVGTSLG